MSYQRLSSYVLMVTFVFFDLPVDNKDNRMKANRFRRNLKKLGFRMLQYSVYIKHCFSYEDSQSEVRKVEKIIEDTGEVGILVITEKQFGMMKYYYQKTIEGKKLEVKNEQLRLF
ncbi:MAG TPA: CRISPR-associated endonuclease Cas2 [Candidatus Kapabacteria bacterium]|jgi:CRISPR-associated protein Cas2|nr:CRISPR-associated endonuclease Cas2 [Candidatus Kapabacteria bacterium]